MGKDVYMANLLSKNNDTEINLDDCPGVEPIRQKCSPDLLTCLRAEEAERVLEVHIKQVATRWPHLVECAKEKGGEGVAGDVGGLKVEREAVIGDNKEEEEDVRKEENNLIEQDRTFPGGEKAASDKSGRQKATEVEGGLPGHQALARGGGGQHLLQGGEQHALVAG